MRTARQRYRCNGAPAQELLAANLVRLDLLIPTFQRQQLLLSLLQSVSKAIVPPGLDFHVYVIDNDSGSGFPELKRRVSAAAFEFPVTVVHEPKPGKSTALNTALSMSTADYVGFVDDDEEIDVRWFEVAHAALTTGKYEFVGGPCLPRWQGPRPEWLPDRGLAVLGIVDPGVPSQPYGRTFPGILSGGNAIVSLRVMRQVGGFAAELGPRRSRRLLSGEDEDLYWRLIDSGAKGLFLPDLIVYPYIHPERLQKRYYRSWFFWNGTAKALLSRRRREPVPHLFGVPRYLFGRAARALVDWTLTLSGRNAQRRLTFELPLWHLAGFVYARHFQPHAADPAPVPLDEVKAL